MTDARKLWTAGSKAPVEVSMEAILAREAKLKRAVRISHTMEYVAGVFVIGWFIAAAALPERGLPPVARIGSAMIACGAVFVLTYLALRGKPPEARHEASTLACYRAQLEHRRDLLSRVPRWYIAPFMPGMIVFLAGIAIDKWGEPQTLPMLAIVVTVVLGVNVGIALLNRRAARKLARELAELPTPEA
jgi:hypothetical protein